MITDKEIQIKINMKNIDHYIQFFPNIKLRDIFNINIENILIKSSNQKINVKCDICGINRFIKYQSYNKNINSCSEYPIYTCDKCSHKKIKIFNLNKYGVEYYSQSDEFSKKIKETSLERFGVEHYSKSEDYMKNRDETNLKKFGVKNPFQLTKMIKQSMLNKYGVEHPSQIEDRKVMKEIKRRKTKEDNGDWIKTEDLSDWNIYKNKVRSLTGKNIDIMFENWNGYDYYDNEYIKDNLKLHHFNSNYPTIDHKISIFEGFNKKINPEVISDISNLCITKRIINIKKSSN